MATRMAFRKMRFSALSRKLWKAKSVDDPELQKLKALFGALSDK